MATSYSEREFYNGLISELKKETGLNLRYTEVNKNNCTLHAVAIQGEKVSPVIYLDQYYKDLRCGKEYDSIIRDAASEVSTRSEIFITQENNEFTELSKVTASFKNYEDVKDKLYAVVRGSSGNSELCAKAPHSDINNLSVFYKILITDTIDGKASVMITNDIMNNWGISLEQLHKDAMENTRQLYPPMICSMEELLFEMMSPEEARQRVPEGIPSSLIVVSNGNTYEGAVYCTDNDILAEVSKKYFHGGDFCILPSSIHEIIATDFGVPEELLDMVRAVNNNEVALKDKLENAVYKFDAKTRTVEQLLPEPDRTKSRNTKDR
jgi:hypothetical protein